MGLFDYLISLPGKETQDGSIADLIRVQYKNRFQTDRKSRDYYFLTDLCNPAQTYWSRTRNDVKRSPEIANKLALGVRLHRKAFYWLRKIPNYTCEENLLNGGYVDIDRVIGRYDMRWGESLVEFKTKPNEVTDIEMIIKRYPQDLEQLCFYAALSPMDMREHFLIFQLDHAPYTLNVFKIEIGNIGDIRTILKQRRDRMDKAIGSSDPSILGKCRYFDEGCDFGNQKVCKCDSLGAISMEALLKSISISFDSQKTRELNSLRDREQSDISLFYPWNLFKPRPCYLERTYGLVENYQVTDAASKEALEKAFSRATELMCERIEMSSFLKKGEEIPLQRTWRGIRIMNEGSGDLPSKRLAPLILKVSKAVSVPRYLFSAYRAELTLACALTSSTQGVAIVLFPKDNEKIQAYRLSFNETDLSKARKAIEQSISNLSDALEKRCIDNLDTCPRDWAIPDYCSSCPDSCIDIKSKQEE